LNRLRPVVLPFVMALAPVPTDACHSAEALTVAQAAPPLILPPVDFFPLAVRDPFVVELYPDIALLVLPPGPPPFANAGPLDDPAIAGDNEPGFLARPGIWRHGVNQYPKRRS
jgi:hypothetical protein